MWKKVGFSYKIMFYHIQKDSQGKSTLTSKNLRLIDQCANCHYAFKTTYYVSFIKAHVTVTGIDTTKRSNLHKVEHTHTKL